MQTEKDLRAMAAIAAMQGLIASGQYNGNEPYIVISSIKLANHLIKELEK